MQDNDNQDGIGLAARLGLVVPEPDQARFNEALARLFDQAALVLSLPLEPVDAGAFEP